jgi:hypothetical protein
MEPARSLREIFAALTDGSGSPSEALHAAGHGDLPDSLVTEAIVNYADTAPVEIAEHLSPFVTAHSAVPGAGGEESWHAPDALHGLQLLATAPPVPETWHDDVHHDLDAGHHLLDSHDHAGDPSLVDAHHGLDQTGHDLHHDPHHDLDHDLHPGHDVHTDDVHAGADLQFGHGQAQTIGAMEQHQHLAPDAGHAGFGSDAAPHAWLPGTGFDQPHPAEHQFGTESDWADHDTAHLDSAHLDSGQLDSERLDSEHLDAGHAPLPTEQHSVDDPTIDPHGA